MSPIAISVRETGTHESKRRYDLVSSTKSYRHSPEPAGARILSLRDLKRDGGLIGCARRMPWQQDEGRRRGILRHQEGNQSLRIGGASGSIANDSLLEYDGRPT